MDKRDDALSEALELNEKEAEKWEQFIKENETAIENLEAFAKHLNVDIMVPMGRKAFMPGQLIHTNEVLVGHYQGYFSKCSAHKAKEICQLRQKMANEHIQQLQTEAALWQNKLIKPYADGVLPDAEKREIIEEYNEEQERVWRQQHKMRVRQAKLKEKQSRESEEKCKGDEEIFRKLEEAELLEELEQELDKLEINEIDDDTMHQLMNGEMKIPVKNERIAHNNESKNNKTNESSREICKVNETPKPVNENAKKEEEEEEEEVPEEIRVIKDQVQFLTPTDQIGFYEYQIQIIQEKISRLPLNTEEQLNEKIRLLTVLEQLEELLEMAEEAVGQEELNEHNENDEMGTKMNNKEVESSAEEERTKTLSRPAQKRRISFALADETLEFRKNETVSQMLTKATKNNNDLLQNGCNEKKDSVQNRKDLIKTKVDKCREHMSETQSKQDFNLIGQILHTTNATNTLHIKFKHSVQENNCQQQTNDDCLIGKPSDFYANYLKFTEKPEIVYMNSYDGEADVKAPILKENDRSEAFADPKLEFSNPSKPILRNKAAVEKENRMSLANDADKIHPTAKAKAKRNGTYPEDYEYMSAYYKVMNDVIEKPLTQPEPLPEGKFIDAHAPKKRISRFKELRRIEKANNKI